MTTRQVLSQGHKGARQACLWLAAACLLDGCSPTAPAEYEFHTGADGAILWRCNRRTGEVDYAVRTQGYWKRVTNRVDQASAVPSQ